ncbi:MAG TPA: cytochrome P460 family protein [Gemmatimonadales bacterium]|nr:cytochrome P460 family protein [Gemmatimonadales bacterium]
MIRRPTTFSALVLTALSTTLLGGPATRDVPYPDGYRGWTHVKSMVIEPGHALATDFGGIHHIYANPPALRTLQTGKRTAFPDGSVLVFDLLAAASGDHAVTEGERKFIGVMHKDAKRYAETGGWGFAAFAGSTRDPVAIDAKACFACHEGARNSDYVFAEWRP